MSTPVIESDAFWQASLQSQRLRIRTLIIAISSLAVLAMLRELIQTSQGLRGSFVSVLGVVAGLIGYEVLMLRLVSRSIVQGRDLPRWFWVFNVLIEVSLPTVIIVMMTERGPFGPYQALVAPVAFAYFIFIALSTLRLSPALCVVTGTAAAAEFLLVVVYTFMRYPDPALRAHAFAFPVYVTHAAFLLVGGLVTAGVAARIRQHVTAALREAETRRKMERIERDLGLARSIQQGLLPQQKPSCPGFDVAGWSQPADETGGDYYDWQSLPDGRLAVSLADVTGHGIGPALVTAVCRAYARASMPTGSDLGRLVDHVNNLMVDDLASGRFVTFAVAVIDPTSDTVQLVSAGHGPILVYHASQKTIDQVEAQNIPFGIAPQISYGPPTELKMAHGDMLILITDGFFEWQNPRGEQFGIERISELIVTEAHRSAEEVIQRLHACVLDFAEGTPQDDDLTAVVIKRIKRV